MKNPTRNRDLMYCYELLEVLEKLEKSKEKRKLTIETYEKKLIKSRNVLVVCFALLFACLTFVILLFFKLELTLSFFLTTLVFAGLVYFYFEIREMYFILVWIKKRNRRALDEKLKKIEVETLLIRESLPKKQRIPECFFNARDVRLLTRYFERQEAETLKDALHFLSLDLKNSELD